MILKRLSGGHTLGIAFGITNLVVLLLAGSAGAAVEINSCTTISSPGEYMLGTDIINSSAGSCINITSSHVTLDGAGHMIDGTGGWETYGVYAYNPAVTLTDITVKNITVKDWVHGIYFLNTRSGDIENNVAYLNNDGIFLNQSGSNTLTGNVVSSNNRDGILLLDSRDNNFINNTAISNGNGFVLVSDSNNNTLVDNIVRSNKYDGIYIFHGKNSNNTLINNTLSSNIYSGIYLEFSSKNIFNSNTVTSNGYGIYLYDASDRNTVANNIVSLNGNGIYLWDSFGSDLTSNNISSNKGTGLHLWYSTGNRLNGNNISYNNGSGIYLDISTYNMLNGNTISYNNAGIYLHSHSYEFSSKLTADDNEEGLNEHSKKFLADHRDILPDNIMSIRSKDSTVSAIRGGDENTITNNTITSNSDIGIWVESSANNLIYNNYFNNTRNAHVDGTNIWNTTKTAGTNIIRGPYLGGNYWSDYTGKDTDGDGLGNTQLPYNSSALLVAGGDYLPLVAAGTMPTPTAPISVPEFPVGILLPVAGIMCTMLLLAKRRS